MIKKIKQHEEYVAEVRQREVKLHTVTEAMVTEKLEKAAQERKRQEQELLHKLEERNRKAELVRLNKERIAAQENTPESA